MRRGFGRVVIVVMALAMVLAFLPLSAAAQGTIVMVNPPSQSKDLNGTVSVDIKVDTVTNLYGVDVRLTFDAARLEAQDADGNAGNGIQVAPGSFLNPAQGFLAQNTVNNTTGQVQYVFALMAPAAAVSGSGVLARITFKAKAAGNAAITLNSVTLSSDQAQPIAATLMNGSITVVPTSAPTPTPVPSGPLPTPAPVPGGSFPYVVQWGDTIYAIARRFGVTADAIIRANNLVNPNLIRAGQILMIPGTSTPPPPPTGRYVVQPGDNLYRIAVRFGTTVNAIAAANHIVNPWLIYVGQVLTIPGATTPPGPPPSGRTHVVRAGDTIYGIAALFGVTPWAIIGLNNLPNPNLIFVGQVLRIP